MLTYSLDKKGAIPLYEQLYRAIKKDITIGILKAGEKLLSKRYLAKRLGISIVTVETSYQQLKAEGYKKDMSRFLRDLIAIPGKVVGKKKL